MRYRGWIGIVLLVFLTGCALSRANEAMMRQDSAAVETQSAENPATSHPSESEKPVNWKTRFTFEGQARPGPYGVDPYVWVYSRGFAERFGMPKQWVSDALKGADAAAWALVKTGAITCGWGGKKESCREVEEPRLFLFFDTVRTTLPWRKKARLMDVPSYGPTTYLTPQSCETKRRRSSSRIAHAMTIGRRNGCELNIGEQPFADPETGEDAFWFEKGITYQGQGNISRVVAFDRESYLHLAWIQLGFMPTMVNMGRPQEAVLLTLETRATPLGKTERLFHEVVLPERFIRNVTAVFLAHRAAERAFYRKVLDME